MNEPRRVALIAAGIALALALAFYVLIWPQQQPAELPPATVQTSAPAALPAAEPAAAPAAEPPPDHYPVPAVVEAPPLPELSASDSAFAAALAALPAGNSVAALLVPTQLIRRLVVTVDNLPRERLAMNDRAFKRVPDAFMVKSRDGSYSLNPGNELRYVPLVMLANAVGAGNAGQLYLRFYPLFDQAFAELGVPGRHFNDRLVQVIDHLLATPEVVGPIELVRPKVFYQFADPALEARSAGQKMLIRMGTVNAAQIKAWLRTFRAQITGAGAPEN
ncbi:MAG: DUF3014 domain-containing protein [Pseudomonadota bacterium]